MLLWHFLRPKSAGLYDYGPGEFQFLSQGTTFFQDGWVFFEGLKNRVYAPEVVGLYDYGPGEFQFLSQGKLFMQSSCSVIVGSMDSNLSIPELYVS